MSVFSGKSRLLNRVVQGPVRISTATLDIEEVPLKKTESGALIEPICEFLKLTYMSTLPRYRYYGKVGSYAHSFAVCHGELWESVVPTFEELKLAARFRNKRIREDVREKLPGIKHRRLELGVGQAEAASVAVTRGWTLLTDDQAAVDLLRALFPCTPTIQTCCLLSYAVGHGLISGAVASEVFNKQIVHGLGLRLSGKPEKCDPPKCLWETTRPSSTAAY